MKGITINKTIYKKIAASVAIVFSILSITEGSQVLLGITQPDYVVLTPLLIYNVIMGIVGLFVGVMIWVNHSKTLIFTSTVIAVHLSVLMIVVAIYFSIGTVALHSVKAMGIRSFVWLAIVWVVWKTDKTNRFS